MRQIKAWHCDFCNRIMAYGSKPNMVKHEKNCLNNPANRACVTCGNFTRNNIHSGNDLNGVNVYESVPACREGLIHPDPNSKTNKYGLRKNCEHWKAKYPGEME